MTSCEPGRSSAYSVDLRWRMLWQRKALRLTYDAVANNLGVDKSTVQRTIRLFDTTGSLCKKPYPKDKVPRKLTSFAQQFVLNLVLQKPGIYLHEIQKELERSLLLEVSVSTLCKFLHASGFTRQRLRTMALQQDELLRQQFTSNISVYAPDMFVSLMRREQIEETHYVSMATAYLANLPNSIRSFQGEYVYLLLHACQLLDF